MRVSLRDTIGKSTILKSLTKNIELKRPEKLESKAGTLLERREEIPFSFKGNNLTNELHNKRHIGLKGQKNGPELENKELLGKDGKKSFTKQAFKQPITASSMDRSDKTGRYTQPTTLKSGKSKAASKNTNQHKKIETKLKPETNEFQVQNGITVSNLASRLQITPFMLQRKIKKEFATDLLPTDLINQELLVMLLLEFGKNPIVAQDFDLQKRPEPADWSIYPRRDPIVTIMGHVDHGKTTLLDSLRNTSVAAGEHGGITQHIGAFSVLLPSKRRITFLDTPGHAAFSAMRKRGAQVTDICVLVVAADDGLMPQTIEAINHCLESQVPLIVALNKCDKQNIDKKKVLEQLLQHNVICEEMGGDVPCVSISAKTGLGLEELEDTIIAVSEINDYRGDDTGMAEGTIIESKMTQKLGGVATVLVSRGTLKTGSYILAGNAWCKVRRIVNDTGASCSTAGPSIPVEVQGWKGLPSAGDQVIEADNEVD